MERALDRVRFHSGMQFEAMPIFVFVMCDDVILLRKVQGC